MLVELPSFRAIGDASTMLENRKCENREKKTRRIDDFFCSINSKKTGKTQFFCSLKSVILRTQRIKKTKIIFSTKQVFSIFCFQEQKTILENTNQIGP